LLVTALPDCQNNVGDQLFFVLAACVIDKSFAFNYICHKMRRVVCVLKTGFNGLACAPSIIRNIGPYRLEQVRYVSSSLSSTVACWNCQKPGKQMICVDCGSLQDVDYKVASS